jgi:hypothetical protein|nr:MAG TPA: elongation factor [Caudoviricetes sp.]
MFFCELGAKYLSEVEVNSWASNQHEFNGVAPLKRLFGCSRQYVCATFMYYDGSGLVDRQDVDLTWYDARESHPTRSEFRLYYTENAIVRRAHVNDLLIIGKQDSGDIVVIIAQNGSPYCHALQTMLGITAITTHYVTLSNLTVN